MNTINLRDFYPWYIEDHLHNAVPLLMGQCTLSALFDEDADLPKEVLHQMDALSHCRTPEAVSAFLKEAMVLLDKHPEYREAGYSRLLRGVECEIIAAYVSAPNHSWHGDYLLSLLWAMEESVHFCYTLNLLHYEYSVFEMVTPDSLINETDVNRLHRKLEVFHEATETVNPIFQEGYLRQLTQGIPQAVIETLVAVLDKDELPEYLITLMGFLEDVECGEVLAASDEDVLGEESPLEHLLDAQAMLHALCVHRNAEYLENDWAEFLAGAGGCPCCAELLSEQAYAVLSTRILTELMAKANGALPEAALCLIRLFLASTVSPITSTHEEEVFSWIFNGTCSAA